MPDFADSQSSSRWRLSPDEAVELATRVAELTKAGLPMGPGVRALAEETPEQRMRRVLHALADRLDAGEDFVTAWETLGRNLPEGLRGIIQAGIRSGRLAEVLEEFVDVQQKQLELRRSLILKLTYPFILLVFLAGLAVFADAVLVRGFADIFRDFGTKLPGITIAYLTASAPLKWLAVAALGTVVALILLGWLASGVSWVWPLLHRAPMVGPLLRWTNLSLFSRLMGVLVEYNVPLPDALRITAACLRDAALSRGCRQTADEVERGQPLDQSLASRRSFPASLIPIIAWGQNGSALDDAFHGATEMFDGRAQSQAVLLDGMLLPLMFLLIVFFVGFFIIAMIMPLLSLITKLSG